MVPPVWLISFCLHNFSRSWILSHIIIKLKLFPNSPQPLQPEHLSNPSELVTTKRSHAKWIKHLHETHFKKSLLELPILSEAEKHRAHTLAVLVDSSFTSLILSSEFGFFNLNLDRFVSFFFVETKRCCFSKFLLEG